MSSAPSVAVVVTCYDQAEWIERAIASVLAQTRPADEIVLIDDGSTDDTPAVCARLDASVRVVRQENAGVSSARNRGLAETTAPFVAFLDADDEWRPAKLERQLAVIGAAPELTAVSVGWHTIDRSGAELATHGDELPERIDLALLYQRNPLVSPSVVLVRRAAVDAAGGFDENVSLVGDYDLWLRLARIAPIAHVCEALALYRLHGANTSSRRPLVMAEEEALVFDKLHEAGDPKGVSAIEIHRRRAHVDRALGYNRLLDGRGREARRLFVRAIGRRPFVPLTWIYLGATLLPHGVVRAVHRRRHDDAALV